MFGVTITITGDKKVAAKFRQMRRDLSGRAMRNAMMRASKLVSASAIKYAPYDLGELQLSIKPEVKQQFSILGGTEFVGVVGSPIMYSCIFKSSTHIATATGQKAICSVQLGDLVLTQSGHYHRVVGKNSFLVLEKPDLVDLEVAWRSDLTHKLTLTSDHKVLVLRDGKNVWIQAGMLLLSDQLYTRRKLGRNKGTGKAKTCLNCNVVVYRSIGSVGQGKMFCSFACKQKYWNSGHNPHVGMKRSLATRAKMSESAERKFRENPALHPSIIVSQRGYITDHERAMKQWLDLHNLEYEQQKPIGRYIVDFYVPSSNTIYEADGAFWHQNQDKDITRDKSIKSIMPAVSIIHIHFIEPRFTPRLQWNPIPDVYYVPVNPGMKSYIDPELFESRQLISLRSWRYERLPGNRGGGIPQLYDLAVEGEHSFFANGILVSNSYQEFGTGIYVGRATHWPPGPALHDWALRHGFSSGYEVARIIGMRGGLRGKKYLERGVVENERNIFNLIGDTVVTIVAK